MEGGICDLRMEWDAFSTAASSPSSRAKLSTTRPAAERKPAASPGRNEGSQHTAASTSCVCTSASSPGPGKAAEEDGISLDALELCNCDAAASAHLPLLRVFTGAIPERSPVGSK